jgi:hypothetical protein
MSSYSLTETYWVVAGGHGPRPSFLARRWGNTAPTTAHLFRARRFPSKAEAERTAAELATDRSHAGERPGNLSRTPAGRDMRRGHVCAAERIGREPTAIAAAAFIWRTHFVTFPRRRRGPARRRPRSAGEVRRFKSYMGAADQGIR